MLGGAAVLVAAVSEMGGSCEYPCSSDVAYSAYKLALALLGASVLGAGVTSGLALAHPGARTIGTVYMLLTIAGFAALSFWVLGLGWVWVD